MSNAKKGSHPVVYTTLSWFSGVCRQIQKTPSRVVDRKLAEEVGATGRNYPQLLKTFRTLNVIDDEGALTERGRKVALGGESYREAIREALQDVYGDLIARLDKGDTIKTAELADHFGRLSSATLGESARLNATRFFRFLVRESGEEKWIDATGAGRTREKSKAGTRASAKRRPTERATRGKDKEKALSDVDRSAEPGEQIVALKLTFGTARLHIPHRLTEEDALRLKQQIDVFETEPRKEPKESRE